MSVAHKVNSNGCLNHSKFCKLSNFQLDRCQSVFIEVHEGWISYCQICYTIANMQLEYLCEDYLKLERVAWCLSFTNLCVIKKCVKRLHLHQHYKINTDNLQYHFQLHKVLFSTWKILLNFSMSLVLIRLRGSDLLVDSSFNSFIFVGLSIDNQELGSRNMSSFCTQQWLQSANHIYWNHSSYPFQTIIDNYNVSSLI